MNIPLFDRLRNAWNSLQSRERLVVGAGAVILLALLAYSIVWAPVQRDLSNLRINVPKQRTQLALMRVQAKQVTQLRGSVPTTIASGNLLTKLEQSAQNRGLREHITRMEPDEKNSVRLSLDSVDFNALLRWLKELQTQNGIRPETATIKAQSDPGLVNARLLMRGPGL
ncbi:MAG: type II secretion system protein M [Gammaproteobacteria bacterium]|jgi:general secretion pathway protein M|nr:type II secretion system protein M [Gammaproteobacteria bacterium]